MQYHQRQDCDGISRAEMEFVLNSLESGLAGWGRQWPPTEVNTAADSDWQSCWSLMKEARGKEMNSLVSPSLCWGHSRPTLVLRLKAGRARSVKPAIRRSITYGLDCSRVESADICPQLFGHSALTVKEHSWRVGPTHQHHAAEEHITRQVSMLKAPLRCAE